MQKQATIATGFIVTLTCASWGLAIASKPPDSEVNPQTGAIEIVDESNIGSNSDIRYIINTGDGDPPLVSFLTTNAADDNRPRVEIESDGDSWIVWWRSGSTDQVLFRRRDHVTGTWQTERLVSDPEDSSRNPEITHDGTDGWVTFEIDGPTGVDIGVVRIDEDPDPFPSPAVVATTSYTDLDSRIIFESGRLWVTWIDTTSDVGWSEFDYASETWSMPSYESYEQDDVQAARDRIRSAVMGP
jgi:hypothetical protein